MVEPLHKVKDMVSFAIRLILLLVLAVGSGFTSNDRASNKGIPAIGALVRVVAPRLGQQWHTGIFNRLRVEPPCYRVVILSSDGLNRVIEILTLKELEKLQVNLVYDGRERFATAEARSKSWRDSDWRDVSPDMLRELNLRCPS